MSDVSGSEIGIRVSLVGGKVAAVEADVVAKSIKGIGDAAESTAVKAKAASAETGGIGLLSKVTRGIGAQTAAAGGAITNLGTRAEKAGIVGAAGITKLGESLKEAHTSAGSLLSQWARLGKYVTVGVVASLAAVAYEGAHTYAEWQEATGAIAANAGITQKAADQIGTAFLRTTGTASYSATELAEAYSKVGAQLRDTVGFTLNSAQATSFMTTSWHLAEATGSDLNLTTQDLSATMQTFHLNLGQASEASDMLYNTARLTGNSLDTLTTVTSRLHSRLTTTMPSLQDMSALMLDLSEHGARGSRGTMVISSALNQLLGNTKSTNDMLASLGVHLFDAQGKFVGLSSVINQLRPGLSALTPQMRMIAEQAIFGSQSWQIMDSVVMDTTQTFDSARKKVSESDTTYEAAEKRLKTLQGRWEVLKASAHNFSVEIGAVVVPILMSLGSHLLAIGSYLVNHRILLIGIATVLGGVLATAMAAFVYVEGVKFMGVVSNMITGIRTLVTWLSTMATRYLGLGTAAETAAGGIAAESGAAAAATGTNDALAGAKDAAAGAFGAEAGAATGAAGAVGAEGEAAQLSLFGPEAAAAQRPTQGVLFGEGAPSTIAVGGGAAAKGASTLAKVAGTTSKVLGGAGLIFTAGQLFSGDNNPDIAIFNKAKHDLPGLESKAGGARALARDILQQARGKPASGSYADELLRQIGPDIVTSVAKANHIPGYASGGIVPGPLGSPTLIMAHGGELVQPISGLSRSGSGAGEPTALQLQALAAAPTGAGRPMIVQLVLDRKVIAQSTIDYMAETAARS